MCHAVRRAMLRVAMLRFALLLYATLRYDMAIAWRDATWQSVSCTFLSPEEAGRHAPTSAAAPTSEACNGRPGAGPLRRTACHPSRPCTSHRKTTRCTTSTISTISTTVSDISTTNTISTIESVHCQYYLSVLRWCTASRHYH